MTSPTAPFNVNVLHELLDAIPSGSWTTYGDLAWVTDLGADVLESHIGSCPQCPNRWRILGEHGEPRAESGSGNDGRSQVEALTSEGVTFTFAHADRDRRIAPIRLPYIAAHRFDYPTIDYVTEPVALATGEPSGEPIRTRHFADCPHWHREENDPSRWIGGPPRLATDEEMRTVPPCRTCISQARKHHNPEHGPRLLPLPAPPQAHRGPEQPRPTDIDTAARRRAEQSHLQSHLTGRASHATCALCGRTLPTRLLVAAHIRNRSSLSEAARYDYTSIAMLACILGCDALFKHGMIMVDTGGTIVANPSILSEGLTDDLRAVLDQFTGRTCTAWNASTAENFAWHRRLWQIPTS